MAKAMPSLYGCMVSQCDCPEWCISLSERRACLPCPTSEKGAVKEHFCKPWVQHVPHSVLELCAIYSAFIQWWQELYYLTLCDSLTAVWTAFWNPLYHVQCTHIHRTARYAKVWRHIIVQVLCEYRKGHTQPSLLLFITTQTICDSEKGPLKCPLKRLIKYGA